MRFVFFEAPPFSRVLPSYLDDAEYRRIYGKGEVKDLTAQQCRSLKRAIHDELSARRGNA